MTCKRLRIGLFLLAVLSQALLSDSYSAEPEKMTELEIIEELITSLDQRETELNQIEKELTERENALKEIESSWKNLNTELEREKKIDFWIGAGSGFGIGILLVLLLGGLNA